MKKLIILLIGITLAWTDVHASGDSLVFYYDFENNGFYDVSGNANGALTPNTGSSFTIVDGKIGNGVKFDGNTSNWLETQANLFEPDAGDYTFMGWYKLDVTTDGNGEIDPTRILFHQHHGTGTANVYLSVHESRVLRVTSDDYGTEKVEVGEWFHAAMVIHSSTNSIDIYINGEKDVTLTNVDLGTGDGAIRLGSHKNSSFNNRVFKGRMDEVALFDKALGPEAIRTVMQFGRKGKPNVLIILADDLTTDDLPMYGGTNISMPNLQSLSDNGMRFTQAFTATPICTPTRSELFTGLYPVRNGSDKNGEEGAIKANIPVMKDYLGAEGYKVGLTGKEHIHPLDSFRFDIVDGFTKQTAGTEATYDVAGITSYMDYHKTEPFCLVVASTLPHTPWTVGDRSKFNANTLTLPDNWIDTEETRIRYRNYLAEIDYLDQQIGDILDALEDANQRDNTLILFLGEQGSAFPGQKYSLWDRGTKSAVIASLPGVIAENTTSDAMLQYVDIIPTLVEMAGGTPSTWIDGQSFWDVLKGTETTHRDHVFSLHSNISQGAPYPIRAVRDEDYKLIWNLSHETEYYSDNMQNNLYFNEWEEAAILDDDDEFLLNRYKYRPEFELYDLANDPFELNNLADNPAYASIRTDLEDELDAWMTQQGDPGEYLDRYGTENAWYVNDATGSDANNGKSAGAPFKTLEKAFTKISDNDTIVVAAGTYTVTQTLDWQDRLTLIGAGADQTIVQASSSYNPSANLFTIFSNESNGTNNYRPFSIIEGLTIRHAVHSDPGGAIYNEVRLKVNDCVIEKNIGNTGGGIYNANVLELRNTLIRDNKSSVVGAGVHNNFTIGQEGKFVMYGSSVVNNEGGYDKSTGDTGVRAGGICGSINLATNTNGKAIVLIENSTISENEAMGNGGGIVLRTLNDVSNDGELTAVLRHNTIVNNRTLNNKRGGGIFIPADKVSLTLWNNIVVNNSNTSDDVEADIATWDSGSVTIAGRNNIVGQLASSSQGTIQFSNTTNNTLSATVGQVGISALTDMSDAYVIPLDANSSAISYSYANESLPQDQIGVNRTNPDAGALEYADPIEFYIENKETGLRIRPEDATDGADMQVVSSSNTDDWVRWKVKWYDNTYCYLQNVQTGHYFRPIGNVDGDNLEQKDTTTNGNRTRWEMISAGDGYFYLNNEWADKYIRPVVDAVGASLEVRPQSWDGDWTQWRLILAGNTSSRVAPEGNSNTEVALSIYPNPFVHEVKFVLPAGMEEVGLEVFDASGKLIRQMTSSGSSIIWDGRNQADMPQTAGLYIYRLIMYESGSVTTRSGLIIKE